MPLPANLFGDQGAAPELPPGKIELVSASPVADSVFPSIEDVRSGLTALGVSAALEVWTREAEALVVEDDTGQVAAVELAGRAKKLANRIEKARKDWVGPFNDQVKAINALCKGYQEPLSRVESGLKSKIGGYQHRKELERRKTEEAARKAQEEAQKKLDQEAKEAGVESVTLPEPVIPRETGPVRTEVGSASQRKVWKFDIVDPEKVPREYLMVEVAAIREAVRAGVREIPGVNIYEHTEMVIRT